MGNHVLHGKKIIVGVCGSIAAYKSAYLVRLLIKSGAEVQVIMTASAIDFISPLTLSTLSKNPALHQYVKNEAGEWNNHVALGLWADAMVVAPASANSLGKFANGLCDNLLSAVYLSARCPVFIAPAMDLDMYAHGSTQQNLQKLISFGNHLIEARSGELASGLEGQGRMAEPEEITENLSAYFSSGTGLLKGKKVLITSGPTYEALDPVRFIGNYSSGKMGFALAEAAAEQGAEVTVVTGPVHLDIRHPAVKRVNIRSAEEMYRHCAEIYKEQDVVIFAAAVADYKPEEVSKQKIKKKDEAMNLRLTKTIDVAGTLAKEKKEGQLTVGFALETENEQFNAQEKLKKKNFDFIVLNSLNDPGAGFGHETNKVTIFDREGNGKEYPLRSKKQVAAGVIEQICKKLNV